MHILAILFTWKGKGGGWLLYIHGSVKGLKAKGIVLGMQRDISTTEPGRIMEVAMWLCIPLLVGL